MDGGFCYIIGGGGSIFFLIVVGIVVFYSVGIYDGDNIEKGLIYLKCYKLGSGSIGSYYFYVYYYVC